jgi:hypothetical protein
MSHVDVLPVLDLPAQKGLTACKMNVESGGAFARSVSLLMTVLGACAMAAMLGPPPANHIHDDHRPSREPGGSLCELWSMS